MSQPLVVAPGLGPSRTELRQLTGLRIVAALWVVGYHFNVQFFGVAPEISGANFVFTGGYLAVDLFFVLSGYIISYQYLRAFPGGRGPYGTFLVRRLARIYPVHLVTLGLAVLMVVVGAALGIAITPPENFTLWGAIQDLLLIRGWGPATQGWNFPAWSLSAEWFAYLLFPVVAWLTGRIIGRRAAILGLLIACVVVEGAATVLLPGFDGMPHPLVRVVVAFVAGAALFALGRTRFSGRVGGAVATLALFTLFVLDPAVPVPWLRAAFALVLACVVIAGYANGEGVAVRLLGSRVVEYGGRISFSVYMIHGILLMIFASLLPPSAFLEQPLVVRLGLIAMQLAAILGLAALLYHLVERPAQRRISAWVRPGGRPSAERG